MLVSYVSKSCVCKHTRPTSLSVNDAQIELQPILNPLPDISDQLSLQIIQEILKASGVDFLKFEHCKCCKVQCHASPQATKTHYITSKFILSAPYLQHSLAAYNQPHLVMPIRNFCPNPFHMHFGSSSIMVCNQHIWPHWTGTCKLPKCTQIIKVYLCLQSGSLITFCMSSLM